MRYFLHGLFILFIATTSAQDTLNVVTAQQGDGIYSLLRKHGLSPSKFYNEFVLINKDLLTTEEFLKVGEKYILPDTILIRELKKVEIIKDPENEIFGTDFTKIDSLSNRLEGAVYYLVSGHGGPDPGAVENFNGKLIAEDEYAYDVTLRLARELKSHGGKVVLIVQDKNDGIRDQRVLDLDTDEIVYPNLEIPLNQLSRLKQRTEAVNKLYHKNFGKYQRLLVTHVDSRSKGTNIDVFFYYHERSQNGRRLAESIHQTFEKKYALFQPNRGYQGTFEDRSNLYMVKNTIPAMAYIEIGNIRSKKDQKRILDSDNRQALAKWISEGIILDFESRNKTN
ncbi:MULTISPECIES: N-acetylmuramoyl-L-alanine amidase family protein [Croceitalea]|uniref:N-acetylmuramoyl-L-alanine amidase n=1 Tax=Croceitalea vernalis TaxID=3075599 RepID=A0ABU3BD82_9FLAO|nr:MULTISPECIES: N-acetylmuramoyl-L-alanine amidase [unclassified Croceitalea]MDT0538271.1 N-acetylmuramoyl-L-alanine amidase [Croceitalea sp. P059]MDT0620055.1 N-acetylmuramoyl-L-alanine amidase [Croceitalea sp. P007]